jgi:AhpD family alkylhydroperoxidase
MTQVRDVMDELRDPTRALRHAIPETWAAFGALHDAAVAPGALSPRTKELIALAIAVVKRCDGCIAHHAKAAAVRGATELEVAEALGVAVLMDGGPATVYGPRAFAAYRGFVRSSHGPDLSKAAG